MAPFYDSMSTPLKSISFEKDALVAAACLVFEDDHPDSSSRKEFVGLLKKKITPAKCSFSGAARRALFASVGRVVQLVQQNYDHVEADHTLFDTIVERGQRDRRHDSGLDAPLSEIANNRLVELWQQIELGLHSSTSSKFFKVCKARGELGEEVFDYVLGKYSAFIEMKDKVAVRGGYDCSEVFGVSIATLENKVLVTMGTFLIEELIAALRKQRNEYNDAERDSQGSAESPAVGQHVNFEADGFNALGRATTWINDHVNPVAGGGGREEQRFNKKLFEAMDSLWDYKMKQKAKTTKVDFIETANLLLRPYKLAENDAA